MVDKQTVIFSRSFRVQTLIPLFFPKFSGSTGIDHTAIFHTECTALQRVKIMLVFIFKYKKRAIIPDSNMTWS